MPRLALFLCGDVMTARGIDQVLPHPSEPQLYEPYVRDARDYVDLAEAASGPIPRRVDFAYVWGDALDELARASPVARIVNLETSVTTSDQAWPDKGIHYRMHPLNVPCLEAAKIDVCVLANNHVLDWGRAGLVETIETLRSAGIKTVGAGRTSAEADTVVVVETASTAGMSGGGRVLIAGVAEPSSGVPTDWSAGGDLPGVALLPDLRLDHARRIVERFQRRRRPGDLAVLSIHWGSNWGYEVPDEHVRFARALVDGGVDVVHGHSSHHPRPIEIYRGKPILYGCGDLISDYEGIGGHESFRDDLVLMHFPTFADGELVQLRMRPMRLRRMRLERASRSDASWLAETLSNVSRPHQTKVRMLDDGSLVAEARRR